MFSAVEFSITLALIVIIIAVKKPVMDNEKINKWLTE